MRLKTKVKVTKTIAPDWKQVGFMKELDPMGKIRSIEAEHAHRLNGPVVCCQDFAIGWTVQMPPGKPD